MPVAKTIRASGSYPEVSEDGSRYLKYSGASDVSFGGAEASPDTVELLEEGPATTQGQPSPDTMTVAFAGLKPAHKATRVTGAAKRSGRTLFFRVTRPEVVVASVTSGSNTVAIDANTGVCTFAGDGTSSGNRNDAKSVFYRGLGIKVGGSLYPVLDVDEDTGQVTVDPGDVSSNVAAGVYSLVDPQTVIGPFQGNVTGFPLPSFPAGGALNTTLTVTAVAAIPEPVIEGLG